MKKLLHILLFTTAVCASAQEPNIKNCLILTPNIHQPQEQITLLFQSEPEIKILPTETPNDYNFNISCGTIQISLSAFDWTIDFSNNAADTIVELQENDHSIKLENAALIVCSESLPATFKIFNISGAEIVSKTLTEKQLVFPLNSLHSGIYIANINDKTLKFTIK